MKLRSSLLGCGLVLALVAQASAQRGDDRGRDSGSRGSWSGGPPGGSFGGGPPGGGFGGFGGGPPGMGGPGGSGFNPADMLKRFDRNGNGLLEPDEMEGPARFMVDRMAQNNPRIDLSKPISIDRLASEMDRMRQERSGSSSGGAPGAPSQPAVPKEPEPLVPGFAKVEAKEIVEGFGLPTATSSIKAEDRDIREADDRIKRYDQNKDGFLSKEEMQGGRWSDDPMQYDRNRDGRLSKEELAVRYAKRRMEESGQRPTTPTSSSDPRSRMSSMSSSSSGGWSGRGGDSRGGDSGGWGQRGGDERGGNPAGDAKKTEVKSYRTTSSQAKTDEKKGLPDWFARSDANRDDQVAMSEYSSSWNESKVAEFLAFDLNRDGIITIRECLAAVKSGARSSNSSSSSSTTASTTATASTTPSATPVAGSAPANATSAPAVTTPASSDVNREWAERQISKYDKNKDGRLTVDEWNSMIIKPTGADADGDGAITLDEYTKFRSGGK